MRIKDLIKSIIIVLSILVILIFSSSIITSQEAQELPPLTIDKDSYQAEDTVEININIDTSQYASYYLLIRADNNSFTYTGDFNPIMFFYPTEEGIYTIALVEKSTRAVFYSLSINVSDGKEDVVDNASGTNISVNESNASLISTDKDEYTEGELVNVTIKNPDDTLNLYHSFEGVSRRFMGDLRYVNFLPQRSGVHELILRDPSGAVIERHIFQVNPRLSKRLLKVINSKGFEEQVSIEVYDEKGDLVEAQDNLSALINKNFSLEITSARKALRKIKLNKVKAVSNLSLGAEEVPVDTIDIEHKEVVQAFAIDPTGVEFSNGSATSVAVGSELWKCRNWDFVNQACLGSWKKIMDLVPGAEYEIEIGPDDPGYAETGVASINTKKPIYHPSERADIIIVVLDRSGRLVSNADVVLTITSPTNQVTSLTSRLGDIVETERGIYETRYNNTFVEGIQIS